MVKIFSGLPPTTWKILGHTSSQKYKNSLPVFLKYETILLSTYFEIALNGDFTKLVVSGEASIEECKKCWVKIVEKSFENSGTYDYIGYADSIEGYNSFLC